MALAFTGAIAGTASAMTFTGRDMPTTVTIARGATGMVPWTYKNTGGAGTLPKTGVRVVFTAPGNTTFASQSTVPSQYSKDGSAWGNTNLALRDCALSDSAMTLTCDGYGVNGGNTSWPAGGYRRFWPQVTVAATAPADTTLAKGSGTLSYTSPGNGTVYTISDGTLSVSTPPAGNAGMCLDATHLRAGGTKIHQWQCLDGNRNQVWDFDNNAIIVGDTAGTSSPMCLDSTRSRANRTDIILWRCQAGNPNQAWVVRKGMIMLKDTIGTSRPMCVDVGTTRNNSDRVFLYQCGTSNPNQIFVVDNGNIKIKNTL